MREAVADRYDVDREIARGGAARVYLARDADGKNVALKVLRPELAVTVTGDRFLREMDLLKGLDHPHIAKLIDSGETQYIIYFVMPYMEGPTLREHLHRVSQTSISDTLHIADSLLDALGYAHEHGIVHRDVKPENIVLTKNGPVLVDFGIARAVAESGKDKLTRSGFAVGTSSYMSPEQVAGALEIDHRSDIYSLGCVLFECLTGRPPFTGKNEDLIQRLRTDSKPSSVATLREGLSPILIDVVDKALEPRASKRWQSAEQMRSRVAALSS